MVCFPTPDMAMITTIILYLLVYYVAETIILELWGLNKGYGHLIEDYYYDPYGVFIGTIGAPFFLLYNFNDTDWESLKK